jgi:hypothetical protein
LTGRLPGWPRDSIWGDAVVPTLAIRVVLLLAALLLVTIFRVEALPAHGSLLEIWNRWDAPHFAEIARTGYGPPSDPARIVLFPLLPALLAAAAPVMGPLEAGMWISVLASLVAAAGLYRLAMLDEGREVAKSAVLAMCVFPTAYAFVAPYSEALFLALVVWALYAGRTGSWALAGLLGLLAAATRVQGVFLFPAFLAGYWLERRRPGRDVIWIGLVPLGALAYLWFNVVTFGDAFHFMKVQETVFHVTTLAPWDALGRLVSAVVNGSRGESWVMDYVAPLVAEAGLAVVVAWSVRSWRRRPAEAVYGFLTLALISTLSWPISVPRYVLGVPSMFTGLAVLQRRVPGGAAIPVLSTVLLTAFMTLFVIGHWAF